MFRGRDMTYSLRIRQSLLKHAFDNAPIGMALLAPDGFFVKVNKSLCSVLGYGEGELLWMDFRMLTHPDDLEFGVLLVHETLEGLRESFQVEKRYIHKQGHVVWAQLTASLLRDEDRVPLFFIVQIQNITDRKHAESLAQSMYDRLLQQEEAFRIISESAHDIISYTDPEGVCLYVSPSVQSVLGYAPEEWIGVSLIPYYHPDDILKVSSHLPFSKVMSFTYRMRHKQGHYVWFESTVTSIHGKDGKLEKYLGIGRDITERKSLEEALRKSEENLKIAQTIAHIGSWDWDIVRDEIMWSDEMYALFEIEPADLIGNYRRIVGLFHPEDQDRVHKAVQEAFAGKDFRLVCRSLGKSGNVKHLDIQGMVRFDCNGKPVKMNGTIQDITERVESERMLEETVERFTSLMKYNPDAVLSMDTRGRFISGNNAAERLTGYTAEELDGMHYTWLVCDECLKRAIERFQAAITGQWIDGNDTPLSIRSKEGQLIHIVVTPAPIIVRNQIVGCYMIMKDVTEMRKKDDFLINSEKQTIAGQMAAAIAHEIRNPLTAIKGFLRLMDTSGFKKEYISILGEEFSRIEMITNELLLLAKPQVNKMETNDIVLILNQVITLLETQANMNNVSLVRAFDFDNLPIHCDENQIKQVIINILKNSIEVMPTGGEATVSLRKEAGYAVIGITDQGCGIPGDMIAKIGQPFYSTKEKGTGLGLMVSFKIVENHGGKILVDSEVGKGTTFEVLLPLFKDEGTGL